MKHIVFVLLLSSAIFVFAQPKQSYHVIDPVKSKKTVQVEKPPTKQYSDGQFVDNKTIDDLNNNMAQHNRNVSVLDVEISILSVLIVVTLFVGGIVSFKGYRKVMKDLNDTKELADAAVKDAKNNANKILVDFQTNVGVIEAAQSVCLNFYNSLKDEHSPVLIGLIKQHSRAEKRLYNDIDYYNEIGNFEQVLIAVSEFEKTCDGDNELRLYCKIKKAEVFSDPKNYACRNYRKALDNLEELYRDYDLYKDYKRQSQIGTKISFCYYQMCMLEEEKSNTDQYLKLAIEYLEPIANSKDDMESFRAKLALAIYNLQLDRFQKAFDGFVTTIAFFDRRHDYYNSHYAELGKLICCNELNREDLKLILKEEFQNGLRFAPALEYCKHTFKDLTNFIVRLEESYDKFLNDK